MLDLEWMSERLRYEEIKGEISYETILVVTDLGGSSVFTLAFICYKSA